MLTLNSLKDQDERRKLSQIDEFPHESVNIVFEEESDNELEVNFNKFANLDLL